MLPLSSPRVYLGVPLVLLALAGCQDPTDPPGGMEPRSTQGNLVTLTVNSLEDPGDGTCDDAHCTLREAIAAAASGDKIVFASGLQGTIALTAGRLEIAQTLTVEGAGRIVIDAQGNSGVLAARRQTSAAVLVALSGLTITNGGQQIGGGIALLGADLTLDNVTVSKNKTGGTGGGVLVNSSQISPSKATIRNSTIEDNEAGVEGGGISVIQGASLTLENTTVSGNTSGASGGGIHNFGTLLVTASIVDSNVAAEEGGAIHNDGVGTATVVGSTISGNTAAESGGGLWNEATLTLNSSTVEGNSAGEDAGLVQGVGGGIYNGEEGTATIVRSTISGNRTVGDMSAGGIFTFGSVELRSSTVTRNAAPDRETGGIMVWGQGVVTMANSILAGNETEGVEDNCSKVNGGILTSLGHNLSTSAGCAGGSTDVTVLAAQVFSEVLEADLADNGGPTKTHALIARGRAADAGYCPGETTDQRSFARPVDDPAMPNALDACDIGAYELQGPVAIVADLMISQAVNKTSVKQGELLTYSIRVQNLGPDAAPNVVVTDILPSGATFVEARSQ